jgi:hypothetical protein
MWKRKNDTVLLSRSWCTLLHKMVLLSSTNMADLLTWSTFLFEILILYVQVCTLKFKKTIWKCVIFKIRIMHFHIKSIQISFYHRLKMYLRFHLQKMFKMISPCFHPSAHFKAIYKTSTSAMLCQWKVTLLGTTPLQMDHNNQLHNES